MLAIKAHYKNGRIELIETVPEDIKEADVIVIIPDCKAESTVALQEDLNFFEWDCEDDKEKKAFSSLTASTIKEWRRREEDKLWR